MQTDPIWEIYMFGAFRARRGDIEEIDRFPTQKTAGLLACLAYYPERHHARESLIDMLWPDADLPAGRLRLRVALSALRRRLEPPALLSGSILHADALHIQLNSAAITTDVHLFERLVRAGQLSPPGPQRIAQWQEAADLYRGELLPGYYEEWIFPERDRLAVQYVTTLCDLATAYAAQGDWEEAMEVGRRAVATDPVSETAHMLVMRLYAASGSIGAAQRQYRELEHALQDRLQARPSSVARGLAERIVQGKLPRTAPPVSLSTIVVKSRSDTTSDSSETPAPLGSTRTPNTLFLPLYLTRFYGREAEMDRVCGLAADPGNRLTTLTGLGGTGKTRLSVEAARRLGEAFRRVVFAPLVDLVDSSRIPECIVMALGVRRNFEVQAMEQLVGILEGGRTLLVLDNFEHLVPEGGAVALDLLARLPLLTLLVTSRQKLELSGETELPLAPFSPPPSNTRSPEEALTFPSVALFVNRAQKARPDFQISARSVSAIVELCRRLEGIPLAIELAASWSGTLTPAQMLARLSHRFDLLVSRRHDMPKRHQTLWATIAWSYQLLEPDVRQFFTFLSAFRGGWTLEAAEAVCVEPRALEYLSLLRNFGLILSEESDADSYDAAEPASAVMRFQMLETLREFAFEQLSQSARSDLAERHSTYFGEIVALFPYRLYDLMTPPYMLSQDPADCLMEREHENLSAALDWYETDSSRPEAGLRMAVGMGAFWYRRHHQREASARLTRLLELTEACGPTHLRLQGSILACMETLALNDYTGARQHGEACLAFWSIEDPKEELFLQRLLSIIAFHQCRYSEARTYAERRLELARAIGDITEEIRVGGNLAMLDLYAGEFDSAIQRQSDLLAQVTARGMSNRAHIQYNLADFILTARCDLEQALPHFREALSSAVESNQVSMVAMIHGGLGRIASDQGEHETACEHYAASLEIFRAGTETMRIAEFACRLALSKASLGEAESSRTLLREAFNISAQSRFDTVLAGCLEAFVSTGIIRAERAAWLLGAIHALRERSGEILLPLDARARARLASELQVQLGTAAFEKSFAVGVAEPLDRLLEMVRKEG